jgi:lysophospholipase L1-like esterase
VKMLVVVLAIVSLAFGSAAGAQIGPRVPKDIEVAPGQLTVAHGPRPTARPSVRLESRVDESWAAWSSSTQLYARAYANPSAWRVALDGCASEGLIVSYRWRLLPLDGQAEARTHLADRCERTVELPALGRWRLELTVRSAGGLQHVATRDVSLRDLLVVAVGDSLTSGEGNPDKNRDFSNYPTIAPAVWMNQQCHRSADSWAAHAARALESRTTTVTFLNFACSGATLANLTHERYGGQESGPSLPPQLEAVRATLGDPSSSRTRQVDALLFSAGINDLGFAGLLEECATGFVPGDDCASGASAARVESGLELLPRSYGRLAASIAANVKPAGVYALEYPARLFTNSADEHGGCGAFELGMRDDEARWISNRGDDLNQAIKTATDLHGWTYLGGIRDAFRGHGYCADDDDTWFRSYSGSKKLQGNTDGTAHPNREGHEAIAELAAPKIDTTKTAPPLAALRIHLISLRLEDRVEHKLACDTDDELCLRVSFGIHGFFEHTITAENDGPLEPGRTITLCPTSADLYTHGNTIELSAQVHLQPVARGRLGKGAHPRPLGAVAYLHRSENWNTGSITLQDSNSAGDRMTLELAISTVNVIRPTAPTLTCAPDVKR